MKTKQNKKTYELFVIVFLSCHLYSGGDFFAQAHFSWQTFFSKRNSVQTIPMKKNKQMHKNL